MKLTEKKPKIMNLTEQKLRSIIREELISEMQNKTVAISKNAGKVSLSKTDMGEVMIRIEDLGSIRLHPGEAQNLANNLDRIAL